jgi:flagellar motility protein MotE (MotC chaperone)
MTDDNVAKVLRAMKAEQVALIMPKLDSEKAVKVSRLLGRFE